MKAFLKAAFSRALACILATCFLWSLGCDQFKRLMPKDSGAAPDAAPAVTSEADHVAHPAFLGPSHDLSTDEQAGGHTLREHVGRTNDQLRERLAHENISAASTYTDRTFAEFAVGNALLQEQTRIEQWLARSSHPNLVLDYRADQPVGRTLHRGDSTARSCSDAKVVLRWISSNEYYVLTSYPEC